MDPRVVVQGPAGEYFSDLLKACEDHFSRIYPDYVNSEDHETVMCPPAFPFGYIAPSGKASGATPLTEIEKSSIDGDNAELKIFYMLEKFGKETNQPMFVLTQVEIAEFFKNVLHQKLPADHPGFGKINSDGEIDFVIVHRHIGVILIEVKATKKFSKSVQGKARKQLQTGDEIIRSLLYVDQKEEIAIPVYKVIAMPNVSDRGRGNQHFISLREIDTRSANDFARWWENNFVSKIFDRHEKGQLQKLTAILVGQKCKVSSKMLSDAYKKIDSQSFLRKSHERYTKQGGDGPQVVAKTADRQDQVILATQFLFLNLEQLRIWNGPRQQFFNGSSGSGKTILLQFKALECAKMGEKVVIVVPSSLTSLYRGFFAKNNISSGVVVFSPPEFSELLHRSDLDSDPVSDAGSDPGRELVSDIGSNPVSALARSDPGSDAKSDPGSDLAEFHFFADEIQTFQAEIPDTMILLEKLLTRITGRDCYCWIAYDYMQRKEGDVSLDETGVLSSATEIQAQARELCKTYNVFHAPCMKTIMRSTFEIYNFVQAFVKKSLLGLLQRLNLPQCDHIKQETKQLWVYFAKNYDVSNYLGHHVCGPSVTVYKNPDFDFITHVIRNEVTKWTEGDSLHHVAVLFTTSFPKEKLSHLMTEKGIPVCDIDNQKNAVVLDFGHKAHSYEWPVVVAISWFNDDLVTNYIMFTRAVSRLIVITTGEQDVSL